MKRWLVAISVLVFGGALSAMAVSPYISNFEAEYHLARDESGRSKLEVTERITVEFPANRNKGIVREIPRKYDGHSANFRLASVTRNGEAEPIFSQREQAGFHVIETGTDEYISGTQLFEFKYSMRDVTRYFQDNERDEFYWDINGTGWRTSIEQLSLNLTIEDELHEALSGDTACYRGVYGSSDRCDIAKAGASFSVEANNLGAGENITIALGFLPETFTPYQPTLWEQAVAVWLRLVVATSIVAVAVLVWLIVMVQRWKYRSSEIGTVVPEYLPPKNASLAAAAAVLPGVKATAAAELTDLAVRRYIQILQTRIGRVFLSAQYDIKIIKDTSTLRREEAEILSDMFGYKPAVGKRLALRDLQNNSAAYARFLDNDKKLRELMRNQYGLKRIDKVRRSQLGRIAKFLLLFAIITLSPMLLVAAIVAFTLSKTLWVLSDEGLSLRRYLKGLELYIKVAEKDRIEMLQSPEGAEKVDIKDPTNPAQLVKLYERVLPYAILFGQEKEWSKQLGEYYASAGSSPDWYAGRAAFSAAAFSSAMSAFSSSVGATSAASSSSSGSGGGGFSGGGGGGGGGGFR